MVEPSSLLPAKLSRPKLYDVLERERLFALLDRCRQRRRAICVVAPPGAGKTTLVATWLEHRQLAAIWFQIDSGDADLATFFYYLGQAAEHAGGADHRALPMLTPEYLGDLAGFSRRFFRMLFAGLPAGAMLVLDNYQEVPAEHPFHALIAQAIEEVPSGSTLLAISRRDPPDIYARMIANEHVALLEWNDLKLTAEEGREICRQRLPQARTRQEQLFEASGGWAAGLTLLLEGAAHDSHSSATEGVWAPQRIFDYFATQVLAGATARQRTILCKLAFVPRATLRLAVALTGDGDAARLLEDLYQRHLFVDRRGGESGAYTFHALFRAFLLHCAESTLPEEEIATVRREAGRQLEAENLVEDAMELHLAAKQWDAALALIACNAADILAAGRWKTVIGWFLAVPSAVVESNVWAQYWLGAAQVAVAPERAREHLAHAHRIAADRGDLMCQIQCAAAIIESCCIEWSRFSLMDPWIPILENAVDDALDWPSANARLRAMNALLSALAYRCPEHPLLPRCAEQTLSLVAGASDVNIMVVTASTLTNYGGHAGRPRIIAVGLALLERWIDQPALTAPNRGAGLFSLIWGRHMVRNLDGARKAVIALERLAEESGLGYLGTFSAFMAANVEGANGELEFARNWFERLGQRTGSMRWYDRAIYCCMAGWLDMYERNWQRSAALGAEGIALIGDGVANSAIQWRYPVAVAHARSGDCDAMQGVLAEIRGYMERHRLHYWGALCSAAEAIAAFRAGDRPTLLAALGNMLLLSGNTEESFLWFLRADLPELFAEALAEGIETDEVRRLITRYELAAPSPAAASWPWKVRIHALGPFHVEVDDCRLSFKGKSPKKPLAILKALICLGARDVPVMRVTDLIWPDLDGDNALRAFYTALFRLRALLRSDKVITLHDGRLSIDRAYTWVDALAFDDLSARGCGDFRSASAALGLYRGALLEGELDLPWAAQPRERLERRYRMLVDGLACAAER